MSEERKKDLAREFGLYSDDFPSNVEWAIMAKLSQINTTSGIILGVMIRLSNGAKYENPSAEKVWGQPHGE
jgi:hypothetical protein